MGSAAAYQLAKRGNKVLGVDQFSPPHRYGSSHGETRVTRQAIGEGEEYIPLVLRSYEISEEIEKATGKQILTITGGLIMTSVDEAIYHGSHFFNQTIACAEKYSIPHHHLEGFVNQYLLNNIAEDGHTMSFVTEAIENIAPGWKAKESYQILGPDEFIEIFELAPPDKGFEVYTENHFQRIL